jgi:hypothetical protein
LTVKSFISAAALFLVLAVSLAVTLPSALLSNPRDNEVWLHQAVSGIQHKGGAIPALNGRQISGQNDLTIMALSLIPGDISTKRIVFCAFGCILTGSVFFYCLALFGMRTAVLSAITVVTSLGFIVLYGSMNLVVLPVTFAVLAYLLFSGVYLKELNACWYVASYLLAAVSVVTGGVTMLAFFALGIMLLILLDLEPKRFLSIHIVPGIIVMAVSVFTAYLVYRFFIGPGFSSSVMFPGEHLGFFAVLKSAVLYASPWIFLVIPAWIYGEGPDEQQAWRNLLPARTAFVLGLVTVWLSSRSLPQYILTVMPFGAVLIGHWMTQRVIRGERQKMVPVLAILVSGILVFGSALVFFIMPLMRGGTLSRETAMTIAGFTLAGIAFLILLAKRKHTAALALAAMGVVSAVWCLQLISPEGAWEQKTAWMKKISAYSPLMVYEDDLIMRGFLDAGGSRAIVIPRDVVPLEETAYLAVSSDDVEGLAESMKKRMTPVVIDTYRAENTYSLMQVAPKKDQQ